MKTLKGARILFIAPRFFGYELDILAALRARGAKVDWLPDRPYDTPSMAAATRFAPHAILPFASKLYRRTLEALKPSGYDHILVVNGQTVSREFLRFLREKFPTAQFTLYMWDSIGNRRHTVDNFPLFDRLFSFDPLAVKEYGMVLRPLFYTRKAEPVMLGAVQYHASFVGTAHSDRYDVVSRLRSALGKELSVYLYLYLQSNWLFNIYKITQPGMRPARREEFRFKPLPRPEWQHLVEQSLAIIDVEHPRQRGLTMRTFETLGLNRKLITTNPHVMDYEFFDKNNISVIDRNSPHCSKKFFETEYRPLSPDLYYRYSIDGWIDDVLD